MSIRTLPVVERPAPEPPPPSPAFVELTTSRRAWIDGVLVPWCRTADRTALRLAEAGWADIAGSVDPAKTLWLWAWGRFAGLVNEELEGLDESRAFAVTTAAGETVRGFVDGRASESGLIVVIDEAGGNRAVSIDEVTAVTPA